MDIVAKMKQDWDRRAHHDARFWIATEDHLSEDAFLLSGRKDAQRLLEGLEAYRQPSWNVLEVGCGIGRLLKPLAKQFASVWGVDVSAEMIQQSKAWLQDCPNVTTVENSGIDLQTFSAAQFDFVFSYVAFQHMPKEVCAEYLLEIRRVLKPQGILKFQICLGDSHTPAFEDTISVRIYQEPELTQMLERAGLHLVDRIHLNDHDLAIACADVFMVVQADSHWVAPSATHQQDLQTRTCQAHTSLTDVQMCLALAKRYLRLANNAMAINTLREIIHHQEHHVDAWLMLVNLLTLENRLEEAQACVNALLLANPNCEKGQVLQAKLQQLRLGTKAESSETS